MEASCKDIHEIYSASLQNIFNKARYWRANKIENNLLKLIDDEDMELNGTLSAIQITRSKGIDQI